MILIRCKSVSESVSGVRGGEHKKESKRELKFDLKRLKDSVILAFVAKVLILFILEKGSEPQSKLIRNGKKL